MGQMRIYAILLVTAAVPAAAGKPTGGTFNPQITYTYSSSNGTRELRVANEDGTSWRTLVSSKNPLVSELGPDGYVYFWNSGKFNRVPVTGGTPQLLFDSGRAFFNRSDLSKDASSVAWFNPDTKRLYRYDVATNSQNLLLDGAYIIDLTYDYTGNNILYAEQVSDTDYSMKSIPATGGSPSSMGLTGRISNVDSAHSDGTLVLAINEPGVGPHVELWHPGDATTTRVADGYNGTFRCDDGAILFNRASGGGFGLYRREASGLVFTVAKASSLFPSYKAC